MPRVCAGRTGDEMGMILILMNVALFFMGIVVQSVTRTGRYKSFMVGGAAVVIIARC